MDTANLIEGQIPKNKSDVPPSPMILLGFSFNKINKTYNYTVNEEKKSRVIGAEADFADQVEKCHLFKKKPVKETQQEIRKNQSQNQSLNVSSVIREFLYEPLQRTAETSSAKELNSR